MRLYISLIISLLISLGCSSVLAQTPFTVTWSFDGNTGASSSSPNVSGSGAAPNGVNFAGVGTYVAGAVGQAVNVQHWSTTGCDNNEFVQVTIQPLNGEKITLNQLSFYYNRSAAGPHQLIVRSSVDGFSADLTNQGIPDNFQQVVLGLGGGAYTDQSGAISFRIMACSADATGGTLRLDNIVISGMVTQTPLPVELLYFRAQPLNNVVQLSWATAWERNADRFLVQRSRDLQEFSTITSLSAIGEPGRSQQYSFIDQWPNAGATYYRLRQIDRDGRFSDSKPVAVVINEVIPMARILENPTDSRQLSVVLSNIPDPVFRLISLAGQETYLESLRHSDGSWVLKPSGGIAAGVYVLQVRSGAILLRLKVLVW